MPILSTFKADLMQTLIFYLLLSTINGDTRKKRLSMIHLYTNMCKLNMNCILSINVNFNGSSNKVARILASSGFKNDCHFEIVR